MHTLADMRDLRAKRERLDNERIRLQSWLDRNPPDDGQLERVDNLQRGIDRIDEELADAERHEQRTERVKQWAQNPASHEAGATFGPALQSATSGRTTFDDAMATIEDHVRSAELPGADADRLDTLLRGEDFHYGLDAQYIAAVGNPEYRSAFCKLLMHGAMAPLRMTAEEQDAVQRVTTADELRSMSFGGTGGLGAPLIIDPTIVLSSAGSISPIRQLASQVTVSSREYKAITSTGVVSAFSAELTEATDNAPTLVQPDIITEKASSWVPYSIEVGMDYPNLLSELGQVLADSKNVLEGLKFALGAGHGSNEPQGLVNGLSGTSIYTTAVAATWSIADLYGVVANLSPRWHPDAKWLMSLPIYNTTKRLVASGSTVEPQIVNADNSQLLSKPWYETSDMATAVAASAKIAVYGNIEKAFRIVDRIGLQIEPVQTVFGPARQMPLGARGLYMWWRTSSGILVNDAARVVTVHV